MTGVYAVFVLAVLACAVEGRLIPQIIGGREAEDGAYPYIVSLELLGQHVCAVSIIDANNILTTAHCVAEKKITYIKIHAGANKQSERGIIISVTDAVIHKDFDLGKLINDIAILHSETPIKLEGKVQKIELPETDISEGTCKLAGWVSTKIGGTDSDALQEIDLKIISNAECKNSHPLIQDSHICTSTEQGQGACFGDSGGPLLTSVKSGEDPDDPEILVQIGILSFGRPCALGYPDGYTRVSYYKQWIEANKKKEESIR